MPKGPSYDRGLEIRKRTLGSDYVDAALSNATDLTRPFQEFVTEYAWGQVWARDGVSPTTRSLMTVAILAALGEREELRLHMEAAFRNGCSQDELGEALFQAALYAGLPVAVAGFKILQEVADNRG